MNNTNLLTISELLSRSWQEIRNRFAPFFLLAGCGAAFNWLLASLFFGFNPVTRSIYQQQNFFLMLLFSLLSMLAGAYFITAFVLFVCKRAQTPLEALKDAWPRCWRLIGGALLYVGGYLAFSAVFALILLLLLIIGLPVEIILGIGLLFFLIVMLGWIISMIYLVLLPYPLILTDHSIFSSFRTAFFLVKGHFWKTLGLLIILSFVGFALSVIPNILISVLLFVLAFVMPALTVVVSILEVPVIAFLILCIQVPLIALYIDRTTCMQNTAQPENNPSLEGAEK